MYKEKVAFCSEVHIQHMNTLSGYNVGFLDVKPNGIESNHCALGG
jgi:hypothetical protein